MEFQPHSLKQEQAIRSDAPIVLLGTGIQFGKTTVGAIKAKMAMHTFTAPDDNFLIVAPTYKILQQSTLPAFLKVMDGMGHFNKADMTFKVAGGGMCYFRTGENPDSIVGITNVRFVWGDEAGLYTLYFWENLQARAAFKEAQIVLTTSPYTLNWLYKQIILPKMRGKKLDGVDLVQAASWENPFMPASVVERARSTMDPRRFNAMFGGVWERMSGLVYDCFDDVENQIAPFGLPSGTRFVGGIDWGWVEPFVFKVRAITSDGMHYGVQELYRSGMTITDICAAVGKIAATWGVSTIFCDPSQPGAIEELNRYFRTQDIKCSATGANNDVRMGIDRHYELLKLRRLKYFAGANPHTLDEMDGYHYPAPDDVAPDQNVKEAKPVQQNDHAMDAERYISISTYLGKGRNVPFVPGENKDHEDQFKRLERLKRGRGYRGQSEDWS